MSTTMTSRYWHVAVSLTLLSIYCVLFYFVFTYQYKLDFSSFYSALARLDAKENPYQALFTTYLPTLKKLSANLNPPVVLWLLTPLLHLGYDLALISWSFISFLLGLVGAHFSFKLAFSPYFIKKNGLNLYFVYLSLFATVTNTAIAQFGALLLFFIITGYYFYLKNKDYSAGILWGMIIAMKFFPALLFFYALKQGRYKILIVMLTTVLLMSLIPWLVFGGTIYTQYFSMITHVLWYGDSWNASLYGFLFRLLVDVHHQSQSLLFIKMSYSILFLITLLWYLHRSTKKSNQLNHQPFCLTLIMMLVMSPFGWLYYFPLLLFPLACTWAIAIDERAGSPQSIFIWLLCLFLLNFPLDYVSTPNMPTLVGKLGFYSFYFYGLLLLAYLVAQQRMIRPKNNFVMSKTASYTIPSLFVILAFGLLIPLISFLMRLFSIPGVPLLHYS